MVVETKCVRGAFVEEGHREVRWEKEHNAALPLRRKPTRTTLQFLVFPCLSGPGLPRLFRQTQLAQHRPKPFVGSL